MARNVYTNRHVRYMYQVYLYVFLLIIHYACLISRCPHADQILSKILALHVSRVGQSYGYILIFWGYGDAHNSRKEVDPLFMLTLCVA